MGNAAGLNDASTYDIVMGVIYGVTAIFLIVVSYIVYTKQFRRQKMEAVSSVGFITAQYNIYKTKTQLLVDVPTEMKVNVDLLDKDEVAVTSLLNSTLQKGEHIIEFDPSKYNNGNYFLMLKAPTTQILKKIIISN